MFSAESVWLWMVVALLLFPLSLLGAGETANVSPATTPSPDNPDSLTSSASAGQQDLQNLPRPCRIKPAPEIEPLSEADHILIKKGARTLHLMRGERVLKSYRIALGRNPKGHKVRVGDFRTPEGDYVIDWRNPNSKFYLSLHISYPNQKDVENARKLGLSPGGAIMIHGLPNGLGWISEMHRIIDWTKGCIAVTNEEIEEIWRFVPNGTPVRIES